MFRAILLILALTAWPMSATGQGAVGGAAQPNDEPAKVKALLVGVAKYVFLDQRDLPRAIDDARGLRDILAKLGVPTGPNGNIQLLENPSSADLKSAWDEHIKALRPGDVSIFFFSGHGAEDQEAYLLGADFKKNHSPSSGVSLQGLVRRLRGAKKSNLAIFIVDACREKIDPVTGKNLGEQSSSFAPPRAEPGTFLMYAAGANQIALHDLGPGDTSGYSVYTRYLLPRLAARGELHEIAKNVRWDTYTAARGRKDKDGTARLHIQTPAYFDEVLERRNILGTVLLPQPITASGGAPGKLAPGGKGLAPEDCAFCPQTVEIPLPDKAVTIRFDPEANAVGSSKPIQLTRRFALGTTEVTRDEWRECVVQGQCRQLGDMIAGDRRPAAGMTWAEADAYIAWLRETTGQKWRWPTEAEWEHGARGGGTAAFGAIDEPALLCKSANGADASLKTLMWANIACDDGKGRGTTPAGSYRANAFGLYDMLGNVWEWVADCQAREGAPASGGSGQGPGKGTCTARVAKGGSWRSGPDALRVSAFQAFSADSGRETVGFRVARDLE